MRYDNTCIIPFTYQRYAIKNTIDIRTLYEQIDHKYVIGTVPKQNHDKVRVYQYTKIVVQRHTTDINVGGDGNIVSERSMTNVTGDLNQVQWRATS